MKLSVSMTRREALLGWIYLLASYLAIPSLIALLYNWLGLPLSEAMLNILYAITNFVFVLVIFWRFLLDSFKKLLSSPWRTLRFAALGFLMYYALSVLLSQLILCIAPDFVNVNDAAIGEMTQDNYSAMAFCVIFLVPVAEEVFYRGLMFQGLHQQNRRLAYLISILIFAAVHVFSYIGLYNWQTLLLCFVQYLPAGLAMAWAYEKADTIFAPILIHITINYLGMSAMR